MLLGLAIAFVHQFCRQAAASQPPITPGAAMQAGQEVADAAVVRQRYDAGASVRLLHPQHYHDASWRVLSALEAAFQCPMGCNVYLTPPSSQVRPRCCVACGALWVAISTVCEPCFLHPMG